MASFEHHLNQRNIWKGFTTKRIKGECQTHVYGAKVDSNMLAITFQPQQCTLCKRWYLSQEATPFEGQGLSIRLSATIGWFCNFVPPILDDILL